MIKQIMIGVFIGIMSIAIFTLGWLGNDIYRDYKNVKDYNGLWIPQNITHNEAMGLTEKYDTIGSWICINVKGMTIEQMINTCEHESSHEIFAQTCSKNVTKCLQEVGIK